MTPLRKTSEILFRENSWSHRFAFCVQVSRKSTPGSGWIDALFCWQKVRKMRFYRRHFLPVWRKAPIVCRGVCHMTLRLPVRFGLNRFRFAGVIPEVIHTITSVMPWTYQRDNARRCTVIRPMQESIGKLEIRPL